MTYYDSMTQNKFIISIQCLKSILKVRHFILRFRKTFAKYSRVLAINTLTDCNILCIYIVQCI